MKQGHFQPKKTHKKSYFHGGCLGEFFLKQKIHFLIFQCQKKHGFSTGPLLFPPLAAPAFRPWTWQHQGEPRALPRARRSPGVTWWTSKSHGRFGDSNDFPDFEKLGVILRFPAVKFLGVSYKHLFLARWKFVKIFFWKMCLTICSNLFKLCLLLLADTLTILHQYKFSSNKQQKQLGVIPSSTRLKHCKLELLHESRLSWRSRSLSSLTWSILTSSYFNWKPLERICHVLVDVPFEMAIQSLWDSISLEMKSGKNHKSLLIKNHLTKSHDFIKSRETSSSLTSCQQPWFMVLLNHWKAKASDQQSAENGTSGEALGTFWMFFCCT